MAQKTANAMKAAACAKQPTEEEKQLAIKRALAQKAQSLAEAIYIQLAGNPEYAGDNPGVLIERTEALVKAWMEHYYGEHAKKEEAQA